MPIIDDYFRLGSAQGPFSITSCLIRPQDMSCAKIGRRDAAAAVMYRSREGEPDFTIETLGNVNPFKKDPKDLHHFLNAHRDAGLPESIWD